MLGRQRFFQQVGAVGVQDLAPVQGHRAKEDQGEEGEQKVRPHRSANASPHTGLRHPPIPPA